MCHFVNNKRILFNSIHLFNPQKFVREWMKLLMTFVRDTVRNMKSVMGPGKKSGDLPYS